MARHRLALYRTEEGVVSASRSSVRAHDAAGLGVTVVVVFLVNNIPYRTSDIINNISPMRTGTYVL